MSLTDQINELKAGAKKRLPEDTRNAMQAMTAELKATGIEDGALKVGSTAPDFALPNPKGQSVRLSDLLKDGPVVINFYRGGWCPYCNLEMRALQAKLSDIKAQGAQLVAISPELPDHSLTTAEKNELEFEVLSDNGNSVSRSFGLVFKLPEALQKIYTGFGIDVEGQNGDDSFELPLPATYVIAKDGTVAKALVDADYTRRMDPEDVLAALRNLNG